MSHKKAFTQEEIAALALQHELPVVSRDGHFDLVPGVRRIAF